MEIILAKSVEDAVKHHTHMLFEKVTPKIENNEVVGLLGHDELLKFNEPVKLANMKHAEAFNAMRKQMWAAMETDITNAMQGKDSTRQSQTTKNDIKWCEMLEAKISDQKINEFSQAIKDTISGQSAEAIKEMSESQRIALTTMVTLNINWRDIAQRLEESQVSSKTDFRWSSVLKSSYEADKVVFR